MFRSMMAALVLLLMVAPLAFAEGNVTATVDGRGKLKVEGDDAGNVFQLVSATPGSITFQPPEGGSTTTVNGLAMPVTVTGVTDKIEIKLEGGIDFLVVLFDAPKDLKIDLGEDLGDFVSVRGNVAKKLEIESHYISVRDCSVGDKAKGEGTFLRFSNVVVGKSMDLESDGDAEVEIGVGGGEPWFGESEIPIAIRVVDCTIEESLKIKKYGPGGTVDVFTTSMGRDFKLTSQHENTLANLSVISVGGKCDIKLKDGADQISMETFLIAKKTKIECKGGEDTLSITDTTFEGNVKADGGDGEADTLNESANTANDGADVQEFEQINRK